MALALAGAEALQLVSGARRRARACDGSRIEDAHDGALDYDDAEALLRGERIDLPTCPRCAVLLDDALEKRRA